MKTPMTTLVWLIIVAAVGVRGGAAPFQNLGFDDANTNGVVGFSGSTADLLPGWQLYRGGVLQTSLLLNDFPTGGTNFGFASLWSADVLPDFVQGKFAIDFVGTHLNTLPFSLVQRGDVPAGATILQYRFEDDGFTLSVNGETLTPLVSPRVPSDVPLELQYGSLFPPYKRKP